MSKEILYELKLEAEIVQSEAAGVEISIQVKVNERCRVQGME